MNVVPTSTGVNGALPASACGDLLLRLRENIGRAYLGKAEVVQLALVALLAEGHLLLEDVPGVGKTLLAKALAKSLACTFHRIQLTPDLLPSDLLGTSVYHPPTGEFHFKQGPLFSQIILADEINRSTPRTQSALLEAMSDRQISLDSQTWKLGPPFLVIATQNPYEFEGTYPLPESQLDRFLLRVHVGYPDRATERQILEQHRQGELIDLVHPVMSVDELVQLQHSVREVRVEESLREYLLDLVTATRVHADVYLGASTRAALAFYRASQALALLSGRDYVVPDDIKVLAQPVLAHRLVTKVYRQGGRGDSAEKLVGQLLEQVRMPA